MSSFVSLVNIHPLVLLSVVDHYNRVIGPPSNIVMGSASLELGCNKKRVLGILLGHVTAGNIVVVTNCYAVPFEEDENKPEVWYLDHSYHESMGQLFRKVNAKENVVGWYHTGPKLRTSDVSINNVIKKYVKMPVLVIIDVESKDNCLPFSSYIANEEFDPETKLKYSTFINIASQIESEESEEIGVEHLLRDTRDHNFILSYQKKNGENSAFNSIPLSIKIDSQLSSLRFLSNQLVSIKDYIDLVVEKKLPVNQQILYYLQEIFNMLPNLYHNSEWKSSFISKFNDSMASIYLASMIRTVTALHLLIDNKIQNAEDKVYTNDIQEGNNKAG